MIDLGDDSHTHVHITAGKVEVISHGCDSLFYRPAISQPIVMPATVGNLKLLDKYLNMHPTHRMLLIAWISYTLAHPKTDMLEFAEAMHSEWAGTPADLLAELNAVVNIGTQRTREWPSNAIALSKRLIPLQSSLLSQGIRIEFGRGKQRTISIKKEGERHA